MNGQRTTAEQPTTDNLPPRPKPGPDQYKSIEVRAYKFRTDEVTHEDVRLMLVMFEEAIHHIKQLLASGRPQISIQDTGKDEPTKTLIKKFKKELQYQMYVAEYDFRTLPVPKPGQITPPLITRNLNESVHHLYLPTIKAVKYYGRTTLRVETKETLFKVHALRTTPFCFPIRDPKCVGQQLSIHLQYGGIGLRDTDSEETPADETTKVSEDDKAFSDPFDGQELAEAVRHLILLPEPEDSEDEATAAAKSTKQKPTGK